MPYTYSSRAIFGSTLVEYLFWLLAPILRAGSKLQTTGSRILLVEPFQMGDVLSLTPMLDPLKQKFPLSEIFILTKPSSGAILISDPRVKVISADFPWSDYGRKRASPYRLWRLFRFVWGMRKLGFDIGIDTRGDVRSQAVMLLAGCKRRIGFTRYLSSNLSIRGLLLTDAITHPASTHRYESNVELLTLLGIARKSLLPIQFPSFFPHLKDTPLQSSAFILIHVGGGWEFKRWATEKWIDLINSISNRMRIVVIAGAGEAGILSELSSKLTLPHSVTCKVTTLEEMIALMLSCSLFIGLDSGPMNLAVCLNKRVIALFGPGDSKIWFPLTTPSGTIHYDRDFPCNPCHQVNCVVPRNNCMHRITVEDVKSKINAVTGEDWSSFLGSS